MSLTRLIVTRATSNWNRYQSLTTGDSCTSISLCCLYHPKELTSLQNSLKKRRLKVSATNNNNKQNKNQKNNGVANQQAPRPVPTIQKVENFLSKLYDFRYNEVSGKIEGKSKSQAEYKPVSDYIINS